MTNSDIVRLLGSKMNTKQEIKERIHKSNIADLKYHKMLKSKNIKLNNKIKIYESDLKSLEVFGRKLCGIFYLK